MTLPSSDASKDQNIESSTVSTANVIFYNQSDVVRVTEFDNIEPSKNGTIFNNSQKYDNAVTFALQVISIITALLSMLWGAVSLKRSRDQDSDGEDEEMYWGPMEYICDMLWNTLCISSQVITLALFASREKYWFAGVLTVHVIVALIAYLYRTYQIAYLSTAKRGDNVLGSVRPSVRPSVCPFVCLSVCRLIARKSHYQSKMFVCVSTNRADAVDRLLI